MIKDNDSVDLLILKTMYDKSNVSIRDLCKILFMDSTSSVSYRLHKLEEKGLITPPPTKHLARSRSITIAGIDLLRRNRVIQ